MNDLYTWFDTSCVAVSTQRKDETEIDRYKNRFLIETDVGNVQLSFFHKKYMTFEDTESTQYFFVSAKYEHRPDLIAYNVYGSPLYYWIVLAANNMKSFWELEVNLTIKLPDLMSVLGGVS